MQITKVQPAVKTAGRYNIYVDGQYSFSLDELQLVQSGLHSGLDIDETELAKLKSESEFGKNYIRAVDLISRRLRSEREIRDYAFRKQWTKTNTGRYSKKRIKLDLQKKGISSNIIAEVLHDEVDDTNALDKLIAKRAKRYDDDRKLIAYLMRNGFQYDDIISAIERFRRDAS